MNNVSGAIPPGLALPSTASSVRLSSNSLTGSLPQDLVLPASLNRLGIDNNSLTGEPLFECLRHRCGVIKV